MSAMSRISRNSATSAISAELCQGGSTDPPFLVERCHELRLIASSAPKRVLLFRTTEMRALPTCLRLTLGQTTIGPRSGLPLCRFSRPGVAGVPGVSAPQLSPDGQSIAFLSSRGSPVAQNPI